MLLDEQTPLLITGSPSPIEEDATSDADVRVVQEDSTHPHGAAEEGGIQERSSSYHSSSSVYYYLNATNNHRQRRVTNVVVHQYHHQHQQHDDDAVADDDQVVNGHHGLQQQQLVDDPSAAAGRRLMKSNKNNTSRKSKSSRLVVIGIGAMLYVLCVIGMAILNESDWYHRYVVELSDHEDVSSSLFSPSMINAQLLADKIGLNNNDDDNIFVEEDNKYSSSTRHSSSRQSSSHNKKSKSLVPIEGKSLSTPQPPPNTAPNGCETTVVLVRHCEKGTLKEHCAFIGYERSVYLATLFGSNSNSGNSERYPAPSLIYALQAGHRHNPHKKNFREIETVEVLAKKVNVTINTDYTTSDKGKLSRNLIRRIKHGELCGRVVLISWKHSDIPNLAQKLGCGPLEGCPFDYKGKDFDSIWQLKYVKRYEFTLRQLNKRLLRRRHRRNKKDEDEDEDDMIATFKDDGYNGSWKVFGSVQNEKFDPLQYSKYVGDYDASQTKLVMSTDGSDGSEDGKKDPYSGRKKKDKKKDDESSPVADKSDATVTTPADEQPVVTKQQPSNWEQLLLTPMQFS